MYYRYIKHYLYPLLFVALIVVPMFVYAELVPCELPIGSGLGGGSVSGSRQCDFEALGDLIVNVIRYVLEIGLIFSAIAFAWAGVLYLTARGDSGQIEKAHGIFQRVIIGFIIAVGAFVIVDIIAASLGLKSFIFELYNSFI